MDQPYVRDSSLCCSVLCLKLKLEIAQGRMILIEKVCGTSSRPHDILEFALTHMSPAVHRFIVLGYKYGDRKRFSPSVCLSKIQGELFMCASQLMLSQLTNMSLAMSKDQTILIAGLVDISGKILHYYTMPDNIHRLPRPPFKVTHTSNGFYNVEFLGDVFSDAPGPVVTATIYGQPVFGEGTSTLDNAVVVDLKRSYIRLKTGDSNGNPSDRSFFFTAVGSYDVGNSSLPFADSFRLTTFIT